MTQPLDALSVGAFADREGLLLRHGRCGLVRFTLEVIAAIERPALYGWRAALLHHVRHFMRDQAQIVGAFAGAEKNVGADGERARGHTARRVLRLGVGVHSHRSQIDLVAALQQAARVRR